MSKRVRSTGVVLGCLVLAGLLLAACGGGGSSSDSGSTGEASGTPTEAKTTAATGGGGSVIQLATELPVTGQYYKAPEMAQGMEAALEAINAEGGVDGHELSLSVCDTKFTANGETDCARQIVGEKPAAVVAPFVVADSSGAAWPIFEKAGLPAIGQQGGTAAEMNSPNAFLLGSGFVGPFAGTVSAVEAAGGAKSVAIITDDPNPAGKPVEELIVGTLKAHGVTDVHGVVGHTESDPTFATAAGEATQNDPEAIILNGSPNTAGTMIQALRASNYEGIIAIPSLLMPPATIEALGGAAEGVYVSSANAFVSDAKDPGVAKFTEEMAEYQPEATLDDASIEGWSGMQLFAEAAKGAKQFEPKALMAAFEAVSKPIELGTSGPWSMVGKTNQIPGFSRIVNPTVTVGVVEGGEIVSKGGGFVNPLGPPSK
jgi:branched-chain amino acid transport system substrate-binding protein